MNLGGDWQFGFTPQCRDGDEAAACATFMSNIGDSGKVALDAASLFQDDCSVDLFAVTFEGALTFYSDSNFSQTATDSFVIGQDTIYGEVVVDYLADEDGADYEFLDVSIETVYVCTSSDESALAATINSDDVAGVGGCLSSLIDDDGPYIVIGTGSGPYDGSTAYTDSGNDRARFSFLTFDTPRETVSVHVQLLLTLLTETGQRRRRMLLEVDPPTANQLEHFVGTVTVAEAEAADEGSTTAAAEQSSWGEPIVVVAIGGAVAVAVLVVAVVLLLAKRSKKRERANCGNGDRFATKPDANLAHHIAVQSSVAASGHISTAVLGKEAEAQTV